MARMKPIGIPAATKAKSATKRQKQAMDGAKGGHARAAKLTPERRREISQNAARARWNRRAW